MHRFVSRRRRCGSMKVLFFEPRLEEVPQRSVAGWGAVCRHTAAFNGTAPNPSSDGVGVDSLEEVILPRDLDEVLVSSRPATHAQTMLVELLRVELIDVLHELPQAWTKSSWIMIQLWSTALSPVRGKRLVHPIRDIIVPAKLPELLPESFRIFFFLLHFGQERGLNLRMPLPLGLPHIREELLRPYPIRVIVPLCNNKVGIVRGQNLPLVARAPDECRGIVSSPHLVFGRRDPPLLLHRREPE